MILGLPLTEAVRFSINEHLVNQYEALDGTDQQLKAASTMADIGRVRHAQ